MRSTPVPLVDHRARCLSLCLLGVLTTSLQTAPALAEGSSVKTDDPVTLHGLRHTKRGQDVTTKALASANVLLANVGSQYRLTSSWSTKPSLDISSQVPVFMVETYPAARTTPVAVPVGCSCVFVNPGTLSAWIAIQSDGPGRLKLDVPRLLAFMLLHEVGHIAKNSNGMEFENGELSELNVEPSIAKLQEQDADEFATKIVIDAKVKMPPSSISIEANWISAAMVTLSWNMQAHRSIDEFGATAMGKQSVFFDPNFSHPNLDWRILYSNYLIQGTPEAKALLNSFEEARHRGEGHKPLYEHHLDK